MRAVTIAVWIAVAAAVPVTAEETLGRFRWEDSAAARAAAPGVEVVPATGGGVLRVERRQPGPPLPLLVVERPAIASRTYAVRGRVRHARVEGSGFLELWSVFADGSRYFSRTVATRGPLASLGGDSVWRPFVLPFTVDEGRPGPVRLELNLVLPGSGSVELGEVTLVQLADGEDPLAVPGQWWTARQAGIAGGLAGLLLGALGAAVGILAARGRSLRPALGILAGIGAAGLLALAAGVVALLRAQPWDVFYPLLLGGGISTVLAAVLLPVVRRRLTAAELQRLRARDVGRGAA
jgi:hypothetical protein